MVIWRERGCGRLGGRGGEIQTRPDRPEAFAVYIQDLILICEVFSHPADPTPGLLACPALPPTLPSSPRPVISPFLFEGKSVFSLSGSLLDWSH